ncbi:uncharacterized protein LOC126560726 [Anopheles maculipalpis]|uniref:uncharacterized protein LOC126560726 n=1 Tax=Anopheles maculipalpis TaxID=1496333 RepID=UPI0021598947|nr:uncharacterized protein LOC126560726 [Anopheles maculipalpis]
MMHSPNNRERPAANPGVAASPAIAAPAPTSFNVCSPAACDASTDSPDFQVEALNAMQLKPLELDTADIHTFFFALENWFDAGNIPSNQHTRRFNILKTRIPIRILPELRHLVESVPSNDRYEAAKRAIVLHFEESQRSRLHRLLTESSLGDRKPSQLLSEMRRTAHGAMTDSMLVDLWVGRLPPYVQSAVIAASSNIEEKVRVAGSVMDSIALYHRTGPYQTVSEVRNEEVERLSRQVAELSHRLEEVLSRDNNPVRVRPRARSRPRQVNRSVNPSVGKLCYYHERYGHVARNCRAPCSFKDRAQGSTTPSTSS